MSRAHKSGKGQEKVYDVVWNDLEFDPSVRAFYYTRFIEIQIPRWTAYDAARFGIKHHEG